MTSSDGCIKIDRQWGSIYDGYLGICESTGDCSGGWSRCIAKRSEPWKHRALEGHASESI